MKKNLLLAVFAFSMNNAQVFSENFNSGSMPTGWTVENPDTIYNWEVGSSVFYNSLPSGAAFFDDDAAGIGSINSSAKLISPVINLSSVSNPNLSFKYANMVDTEDSILKVEVFNGTAWVQVFSFAGLAGTWDYDPDTFDEYLESYDQTQNINLTPYANANFKVRFVYDDAGDYSYGVVVDDVIITSGILGTSDMSSISDKIKVYPNPVKDYLFITSDVKTSKISLIDMSGKQIKTFSGKSSDKYDLSDLQKGVYLLLIDNGKEVIKKKIIKK